MQGIEVLNDRPAQWQATDLATDSQKFANTPNRKQFLNPPEQGIDLLLRPDRRASSADPADSAPTSSRPNLILRSPAREESGPPAGEKSFCDADFAQTTVDIEGIASLPELDTTQFTTVRC